MITMGGAIHGQRLIDAGQYKCEIIISVELIRSWKLRVRVRNQAVPAQPATVVVVPSCTMHCGLARTFPEAQGLGNPPIRSQCLPCVALPMIALAWVALHPSCWVRGVHQYNGIVLVPRHEA